MRITVIRKLVFYEEIINRRVMLLAWIIIRLLALFEEQIIWKFVFGEIIKRVVLFEEIMWRVILFKEIIRR